MRFGVDTKRLAVICPTWVGDCVMATPVLRAARRALPKAQLIALGQPGLESLLMPSPWLDGYVGVDAKGVLGAWRAAKALRGAGAESVLILPNSFRSALVCKLAGVRTRAGVRSDGRGWLLTDALALPAHEGIRTTLEHYALLAECALGLKPGEVDRRMELGVSAAQQSAADEVLRDVRTPFALMNPGAVRSNKRWPAERFAAAADALQERFGLSSAVTGSPGEGEILNAVVRSARHPVVNLAERGVTLGSLKGVIRRAAVMLTNDTGPRHMAIALGTPVVSLFGPTDARHTVIPGAREHMLRAEPFLPEELLADEHERACVIDRISVGDVVAACGLLLGDQLRTEVAARGAEA